MLLAAINGISPCVCRQQAIEQGAKRAATTAHWLAHNTFLNVQQLEQWRHLVSTHLARSQS